VIYLNVVQQLAAALRSAKRVGIVRGCAKFQGWYGSVTEKPIVLYVRIFLKFPDNVSRK